MVASSYSSLTTLRVITQRLTATPIWQLPHIVPYLATTIPSCAKLLQNQPSLGQTNDGSETAVLIHKFKTRISTLLAEKSPQAKWAAVVLIKATVETGGWEVLRASGAWIRGLLGILQRPDPVITKELSIITLTRIFLLSQDHHSLVREITTPSLTPFITSCLNILKARPSAGDKRKAKCHYSLPLTVIQALCELIPNHPSVFRPFVAQIRLLVQPLIAPTHSDSGLSQEKSLSITVLSTAEHSRKLFLLLNVCAPKNTSGDEWTRSVQNVINSSHRTADLVFRAVMEDWEPSSTRLQSDSIATRVFSETVSDMESDDLGLPGWRGIYAGMERLDGLLRTTQTFLTGSTPSNVNLSISSILDVVTRVLSVTAPVAENGNGARGGLRANSEIGRDEREGLFASLPNIHVLALGVLSTLISRLGYNSASFCQGALMQALWLFESEFVSSDIRKMTYELIAEILALIGLSLSKSTAPLVSKCAKKCCEDLMSPMRSSCALLDSTQPSRKFAADGAATLSGGSYFRSPTTRAESLTMPSSIQLSACKLLPFLLTHVPRDFFSFGLRAEIDRAAILTRNKKAMLASVLNPPLKPKSGPEMSSSLVFLAREFPDSLEVDALMRPRLPVLQRRGDDEDGEFNTYEEGMLGNEDITSGRTESLAHQAQVEKGSVLFEQIKIPIEISVTNVGHAVSAESTSRRLPSPISRGQENQQYALHTKHYLDESVSNTKYSNKISHGATPQPNTDFQRPKRPRLEPDEATSTNLTMPPPGNHPIRHTGGRSFEAQQPSPQNSARIEEEEVESDDSEIPFIDTGMDTDEDEKEDDDQVHEN
ncbi:hypothetical protein MMC31_005009 [Peltigera leucophlebia]|nr:hypothetical protein [Peltigera leucophlebia]